MFTTSVGTPLDASHVRRDFRALCKNAGIEGVWAPRELRHTFVSVMSVSGVAVEEIARLAGHASSRTTETIYRHELPCAGRAGKRVSGIREVDEARRGRPPVLGAPAGPAWLLATAAGGG